MTFTLHRDDVLQAPFPWFGGKSRVAGIVWEAFGDVDNYVEPFFGSGAVLLGAPWPNDRIETVNDKDGYVANFWRAVSKDPGAVSEHADWPVIENDLHARHASLVRQKDDLVARLEGDPDWCDAKIAGWWVWGICCWIGGGFCSGDGPWAQVDGMFVHGVGRGVSRRRVHLGNAGQGVARGLVHLSDGGHGVHRQRVHLSDGGQGVHRKRGIVEWFDALADRMRRVRVCCGDWSRVTGPSPTIHNGLTGVFLDPPYSADSDRTGDIYACEDLTVAHDVRQWCVENGGNKLLRIALCGYAGEHDALEELGWRVHAWKPHGGYGGGRGGRGEDNKRRERVWFSPHCIDARWRLL